jgi:hypothetical protein
VRSLPVFVPYGNDHLAAVVALPDGPPRSVAIFPLQALWSGTGRVFWAQAARELSACGVASVRFEHSGHGDSTGSPEGGLASIVEPARETVAVARFAMDVLGLGSFAVASTCFEGGVVLEAATDPRCIAAVAVNTRTTDPGARGRLRRVGAGWRLVEMVRRRPALRRALAYDRITHLLRDRIGADVSEKLERSSCHARVLLIDDAALDRRVPADMGEPYCTRRDIPFGMLRPEAFELNSGEQQVLEALVQWIADSLSPPSATPSRPGEPAALGG